ncbi:hypothetical protein [Streptomyces sp. NPDC057682]|uniref:hypothetical protein n=1 Tax=Streptomyces sp. NPDC057682 TaxID=3346210 RepID=UPI00367D3528
MTRGRVLARGSLAVACALLAWQVWMLFHVSSAESARVRWSCDASECATDDLAGGAPFLGALVVAALALLARRFLHRAAPGAALTLAALAFGAGWRTAVDRGELRADASAGWLVDRLTVSDWITVSHTAAALFALTAVAGAVSSLRRTNGPHRLRLRLRGRLATAEAELHGWERTGRHRGRVEARFTDADGVRRAFPAVVPRAALGRRTLVLYDRERPGDATHSRVSLPRTGPL